MRTLFLFISTINGYSVDQNECLYSSLMKMDKDNTYGRHHGQSAPVLLVVSS